MIPKPFAELREILAGVGNNSVAVDHEAEASAIIERIIQLHGVAINHAAGMFDAGANAGKELLRLRECDTEEQWRAHIKTLPFSDRTRRRYMAQARSKAGTSGASGEYVLNRFLETYDDDIPKQGGQVTAPVGSSISVPKQTPKTNVAVKTPAALKALPLATPSPKPTIVVDKGPQVKTPATVKGLPEGELKSKQKQPDAIQDFRSELRSKAEEFIAEMKAAGASRDQIGAVIRSMRDDLQEIISDMAATKEDSKSDKASLRREFVRIGRVLLNTIELKEFKEIIGFLVVEHQDWTGRTDR